MQLGNGQAPGQSQPMPFGVDRMVPVEAQKSWPKSGTKLYTTSARGHVDGKTRVISDDQSSD